VRTGIALQVGLGRSWAWLGSVEQALHGAASPG